MKWIRRHQLEFFCLCLASVVICLRLLNITHRLLIYDELWTCIKYASKDIHTIFTDVATPNNHPLNSLLIKWSSSIIGLENLAVRLPSLLAFAGTFLLLLFTSKKCFKYNASRFLVCIAFLFHGGLQYYAETARGYSLQTLGMTMVLLALLLYDSEERKKERFLLAGMFLKGALVVSLAVSSGVIFATAIAGGWLILSLLREKKTFFARAGIMFAGFGVYALFVLFWYVGNYSEFAKGQVFGETLNNLPAIWRFFSGLFCSLGVIPLLGFLCGIAGIFFCKEHRQKNLILIGLSAVLVLLSAFVLKAGPPRIYLPFVTVLIFGSGFMLDALMQQGKFSFLEKREGLLAGLLLIAFCLCESHFLYRKWAEPDWRICIESIMNEVSKSIAVAYPPTDVLALSTHFDEEIVQDHLKRLESPDRIMLTSFNQLGVMDQKDFHTTFIPFQQKKAVQKDKLGEIPCWLYLLRPLQSSDSLRERNVFCIVKGLSLNAMPQELKAFPVVNFFLGSNQTARKYPPAYLLYVTDAKNAAELLTLEREYPVKFLIVP